MNVVRDAFAKRRIYQAWLFTNQKCEVRSLQGKVGNLPGLIPFLGAVLLSIIFSAGSALAQTAKSFGSVVIEGSEQISNLEKEAEKAGEIWNAESIRNSVELYRTAADRWTGIGDKSRAAFCLREASANALLLKDGKSEAIDLLRRALQLSSESSEDKIKTLSSLSLAFLRLGEIKESEVYVDKAYQLLSSRENSAAAAARAVVYTALAQLAREKNDNAGAIKNFEEALILWQKAGGSKEEAQTLLDLSFSYLGKDEPFNGLKRAEESLKKWQEIGSRRGEAMALIAAGQMLFKMGEYQAALDAFQKAETLFPPDVDLLEKAVLFNSMANIYETYELWKLSLIYYEKAFKLYQAENNLYAQLATYPSLGKSSYKLGNRKAAEEYFNAGFNLSRKLNDRLFEAVIDQETGNMYFEAGGDDKTAARYYNQALEQDVQLGNQRFAALIEGNLGKIFARQKNFPEARRYFEHALQINRRIKSKLAEADILFNLAKLDEAEGEIESAARRITDSITLTESVYSDVAGNNLRSNYFSSVYERYELYIKILMKLDERFPSQNYAFEAFRASERSRARSMFEILQRSQSDVIKMAAPETLEREKEIRQLLNAKADRLTDLLSQSTNSGGGLEESIEQLEGEISELEHELEQIRANLEQKSPFYSELKNPAIFEIAEFQKTVLDDQTLFLEFSFGEDESYLWAIEKNKVSRYILPGREALESQIQNLRFLISTPERHERGESTEDYQNRIAEAERVYWQKAQILSDQLFGQIADQISGGKRLAIAADGKLHYFPVSALPFPGGSNSSRQPILLTNEVVYEPSASILNFVEKKGAQQQRQQPLPPAEKNLLVLSDAVFSLDDPRIKAGSSGDKSYNPVSPPVPFANLRSVESLASLSRLTASKDEGETIAEIVGSSKSSVITGFAANRQFFLNTDISNYKIIHLATHGLIDEDHPELSGILLSRFDENGRKIDEFVRLQDINGLNLSADLVVLSACSTGIGKEIKGQGLSSLTNAFLQAGARSVVSSLWKVDDYAALELMKNFYGNLAGGKVAPSEALRQAQIKMWQNRRYQSPFYWAAFTAQGDYRRPLSLHRQKNYSAYLLMGLALLIVLLLIYRFYPFSKTK